ncbi:MAG: porin family protein [Porphyromonas sp.]|nr:porin family protein [Porphyromonas sp.]
MKRIVLAAIAALATSAGLAAQTSIKPRVEIGLNLGKLEPKESNLDFNIAAGLRAGVALEFALSQSALSEIYLAPGLTYKNHGAKVTKYGEDNRLSMNSLSLPVNLGLRASLGNDLGVSLEFGPYFSYLLSSSYLGASKNEDLKRFDAGINGSVALEYQRYFIRLGAEYGFTDLNKPTIEDNSLRNMGIFTTIGMTF